MRDSQTPTPERSCNGVSITFFLVLGGVLVGLVWKWTFFRFADSVYSSIVIRDSFFPALLRDAAVLRIAYLVCIGAILLAMMAIRCRGVRTSGLAVSLLACTVLVLHQGSYNDMTFVTSWWCLVFTLWYSTRIEVDPPERLLRKASLLGRVIVSIVLLGGAVGKWTGEYWSGQVLYEIYFVDRNFWTFNWLRGRLDAAKLREFATWYSRSIIAVESLGGLSWLLPPRLASFAGIAVFLTIGLLSNYQLFSVLAPMIGLAATGWFGAKHLGTNHSLESAEGR